MLKNKILIVSSDAIGEKMAGPAIRYWQMASLLSNKHEVTLLVPNKVTSNFNCNFNLVELSKNNLKSTMKNFDILIVQGMTMFKFPFIKNFKGSLIVDLYDPTMLEMLELRKSKSEFKVDLDIVKDQLDFGDYFICASEKQKDLWIGMLLSTGRISPSNYVKDKKLDSLIGVVPFGIEKIDPVKKYNPYLKFNNISEEDKILVWGGGIWDWLDPFIIISAMEKLVEKRQDIKLVFLGTKHPTQPNLQMTVADKAILAAKEKGLLDEYIFFNDWVSYNERDQYLLSAFAGVSFHINHLETKYSFRTRILDYIWCKLPMILTEGDLLAEIIDKNNCGIVIKENAPEELAQAILHLVDDERMYKQYQHNLEKLRENFYWETTIADLMVYCNNPQKNFQRKKNKIYKKYMLKASYYKSKTKYLFTKRGINKLKEILNKK